MWPVWFWQLGRGEVLAVIVALLLPNSSTCGESCGLDNMALYAISGVQGLVEAFQGLILAHGAGWR